MNRTIQNNMQAKGGMRAEGRFDMHAAFAASFRDWRQKNNLTLKEVAFNLGLSISTVNCWELGQRFPSGRHLEMLMNYTGLPPCSFFCVKSYGCVNPLHGHSQQKQAPLP